MLIKDNSTVLFQEIALPIADVQKKIKLTLAGAMQ